MTKHIKIKLPVGALIGGLRHLGNGEFIGEMVPAAGGKRKPAPTIIEGMVSPEGDPNWPDKLVYELVDDPLADGCQVVLTLVCGLQDGEPREALLSEQVIMNDFGVNLDEFLARRGEAVPRPCLISRPDRGEVAIFDGENDAVKVSGLSREQVEAVQRLALSWANNGKPVRFPSEKGRP